MTTQHNKPPAPLTPAPTPPESPPASTAASTGDAYGGAVKRAIDRAAEANRTIAEQAKRLSRDEREVCAALRQRREALVTRGVAGASLDALETATGIDKAGLSRFLNGHTPFRLERALAIAHALDEAERAHGTASPASTEARA